MLKISWISFPMFYYVSMIMKSIIITSFFPLCFCSLSFSQWSKCWILQVSCGSQELQSEHSEPLRISSVFHLPSKFVLFLLQHFVSASWTTIRWTSYVAHICKRWASSELFPDFQLFLESLNILLLILSFVRQVHMYLKLTATYFITA